MPIGFIGDVHGEWEFMCRKLQQFRTNGLPLDMPIVQVGDLGLFPGAEPKLPYDVYFIPGNHEYFPYYEGLTEVTEVYPRLHYIPRGTVMKMDGRRVGFLGGGDSIDKQWRTPGYDWFPEETVTAQEAERLMEQVGDKPLDLLVTHTPPLSHFMPILKKYGWQFMPEFAGSTRVIEAVWSELGKPPLICGHMHIKWQQDNVRVLDILETVVL